LEDLKRQLEHSKSTSQYHSESKAELKPKSGVLPSIGLILHFHLGNGEETDGTEADPGFNVITLTPNAHEAYLREFALATNYLVISINCKVERYPTPYIESWNVYNFILAGKLGFIPNKIVFMGDGLGANLAIAVTLKAINERIRLPDCLTLFYPVLDCSDSITPSRILNMADPVLNYHALRLCREAYAPLDTKAAAKDYFLSPLQAPSYILRSFPDTYICSGGFDPMLDDHIAFVGRLTAQKRRVHSKLFEEFPYGFLGLARAMPEAKESIKDASLWLASKGFNAEHDKLTAQKAAEQESK